jgi:uncharacterized protein (TIGR00290 family)
LVAADFSLRFCFYEGITIMPHKAWVAWSSGKDSLWALHVARQMPDLEIIGLMTTITATYARVSMHGVRETLLEMQAQALGLPLYKALIPTPCSNEAYQEIMKQAIAQAQAEGVTRMIFGDLFLPDIRAYREQQLAPTGIEAVFPLWGKDTDALAREMIAGGLQAYLTCVDPRKIDQAFAGRRFDSELLEQLPAGVDPCGENGEFHSFAYAGPDFAAPLEVVVGETVERDGFVFTDILPATEVK